jgi:HTH-type transcriptional regulator / antitoxin HipB
MVPGVSVSTLGRTVRERREALGLTQDELAVRAGSSRSTITRIELEGHVPSVGQLRRIGDVLGVDLFTAARAS